LFKLNVNGCTSHGWTYVYHNTGYCLLNGADGGTGISFPPTIPCTNKVFKNNIIISNEWSVRAGRRGYELDGNCYFHVPGKPPRRYQWDKKIHATLANYQRATDQEKQGMYADPKLKDIPDVGKTPSSASLADLPPKQYRHLQPHAVRLDLAEDSPCINVALHLRGINDRDDGQKADIGALEHKVEAGTRLVCVSWAPDANATWDTHGGNFTKLKTTLLPQLDAALPSLLLDLVERGLLERTLVVVMGEFGRTPKINKNQGGRDHWNFCYSLLLAGGGLRAGYVHGASDSLGGRPRSQPVTPADVVATIYHCLGIPHDLELHDNLNRPFQLVPWGNVIPDLLA
jgi:arylsulfatase A-like enzyme